MLKTIVKLGKNQIGIEAENPDEFFVLCGIFARTPHICGNCGSDDIRPHGEKKKDDPDNCVYCSIRCYDCRYQLRFGRRMDGQFYIRDDEEWRPPHFYAEKNRRPEGSPPT